MAFSKSENRYRSQVMGQVCNKTSKLSATRRRKFLKSSGRVIGIQAKMSRSVKVCGIPGPQVRGTGGTQIICLIYIHGTMATRP